MATLEHNDLDGSLPKGDFRRETEFLERIVSRSEFTRFSKETKTEEPEQVVKIVDTGQSIEESLCPKNGTVVTISDNAMYGWNRPNFDRGPLPMNRWRIDGLFGFMTQIVWPRFVCDQSAARLMRMDNPPLECRLIVGRYRHLNSEARRLAQLDIRKYLTGMTLDLHFKVYEAIVNYDWQLLLKLEESRVLALVGITQEHMQFAIPLLKSEDKEVIDRGATALAGMLLMPLIKKDCEEGRFGGIPKSKERREIENQQSECMQEIRHAAKTYYAGAFLELGTSDELVRLEKTAFSAYRLNLGTTQDYMPRILAWHSEQVAPLLNALSPK